MMRAKFCIAMCLLGLSLSAAAQTPNVLRKAEKKNGWVLLFDGKTTSGWTTVGGAAVPAGWEVLNGELTAVIDGKGGDIISVGQYGDFELSLQYKINVETNSGVKYFFTKYEDGGNLGLEFQILDDKNAEDNKKDNHLTGSLYDLLAPSMVKRKVNPPGQWNTIVIRSEGKEVSHSLNGFKILEFTRGGKEFKDAVAGSKFSKVKPEFGSVAKGHILLQEHGGLVAFRNIKIRELKTK